MPIFDQSQLRAAAARIFRAAGSSEAEAGTIARLLVEANLCGHDSHGIGCIPHYVDNILDGTMILNQRLGIALDTPGMLICDGGLGAGQSMGHAALGMGIERAQANGSCLVSLRHSHHLGRIGHWAEFCAAAGLISVHFVNVVADPAVAPYGGTKARLGTNPFAAAFPRAGQDPILVDFATSRLAVGKVRVAYNRGERVPPGVLLDAEGRPTTDPSVMVHAPMGCLLPFGGHKGGGLALACELLAAAMVGAPVQSGPAPSTATANSMFSILISPEILGTAEAYARQLAAVTDWLLSENAEGGAVMLPGTPERLAREARTRDGIEIDPATLRELRAAAEKVGLTGAEPF